MTDILWILLQWAVASLALSLAIGHVFAAGAGRPPRASTGHGSRRTVGRMAPPEERMSAVVRPPTPPRSTQRRRRAAHRLG